MLETKNGYGCSRIEYKHLYILKCKKIGCGCSLKRKMNSPLIISFSTLERILCFSIIEFNLCFIRSANEKNKHSKVRGL